MASTRKEQANWRPLSEDKTAFVHKRLKNSAYFWDAHRNPNKDNKKSSFQNKFHLFQNISHHRMSHISPHHYVHVINELLRLTSVNVCWDRIALTSQLRTLKLRSHKVRHCQRVNLLDQWHSDTDAGLDISLYDLPLYSVNVRVIPALHPHSNIAS